MCSWCVMTDCLHCGVVSPSFSKNKRFFFRVKMTMVAVLHTMKSSSCMLPSDHTAKSGKCQSEKLQLLVFFLECPQIWCRQTLNGSRKLRQSASGVMMVVQLMISVLSDFRFFSCRFTIHQQLHRNGAYRMVYAEECECRHLFAVNIANSVIQSLIIELHQQNSRCTNSTDVGKCRMKESNDLIEWRSRARNDCNFEANDALPFIHSFDFNFDLYFSLFFLFQFPFLLTPGALTNVVDIEKKNGKINIYVCSIAKTYNSAKEKNKSIWKSTIANSSEWVERKKSERESKNEWTEGSRIRERTSTSSCWCDCDSIIFEIKSSRRRLRWQIGGKINERQAKENNSINQLKLD